MTLPEPLRRARGALVDTMVFIYLFEDAPRYGTLSQSLIENMSRSGRSIVVTPVTMAELLVKPVAEGRPDIADTYRAAIDGLPHRVWAAIDHHTGCLAGALKAKYRLKLPDAFQVACALQSSSVLVTNDAALRRVTEVPVCLLDDLG